MVADVLLLPSPRSLIFNRKTPNEVGIGIDFEMALSLANKGKRTIRGYLWDAAPTEMVGEFSAVRVVLKAGERVRVARKYQLTERGKYELDVATLEIFGPLGWMRRIVHLSSPAKVVGVPGIEVLQSNRLILEAMQDADIGINRARGVGRGGEFESLAPYVPGDPPNTVDWKGYARSGVLTVRRYEPERRRSIMLCCDAGRLMGGRVDGKRKVDLALGALARLAAAALQRGDLVGLMIFDGEVKTVVPPRSSGGQLARLIRASIDIEPSYTETAYTPAFVTLGHTLSRRSLVVLATDFDNEAQGWELRRNIEAVRKRHVVMVCGMRDPIYYQTLSDPVQTLEEGYRQLAALTLLEERSSIYSGIRKGGVHTIDAEPNDLSGPMLNLYGQIVRSGAL